MDPFGLFGAFVSHQHKERMVKHYGFIPSESGTQDVRGLSRFLSDFVLNVGPLAREDGGYDAVEQAEVREQLLLMPVTIYLQYLKGLELQSCQ